MSFQTSFDKDLKLAIKYKMTPPEIKVFTISLIYNELSKHIFPQFHHQRKTVVDPRRGFLFKCCHKMAKETEGRLKPKEYKLFIKAQLDILKKTNKERKQFPRIDPIILLGEKAWKRWIRWKLFYQSYHSRTISSKEALAEHNYSPKIIKELAKSKKTLTEYYPNLNKENILYLLGNHTIIRWLAIGTLSPYYLALSPIVHVWMLKNNLDYIDYFQVDIELYIEDLTDDVKVYFKNEFPYEIA